MTLQDKFHNLLLAGTDISEHLPTLLKYAKECSHITEFGTRTGVSTVAFLLAKPARLLCYDIERQKEVDYLEEQAKLLKVDFKFLLEDTRRAKIEETDLLFIDTLHSYSQLVAELKSAPKVSKYIIFHDTVTYGNVGEGGGKGLLLAIDEFLSLNPEWIEKERWLNNNGLLVLERQEVNR